MKKLLLLAVVTATATPVFAADVGVSVSIGQPGFYGQIDIGDFPHPRVLYREPIIIERGHDDRPPIYMRVPPGYAKHWDKHCREYHACDRRVYFVHDDWYQHEYVPRYQERHRDRRDDDHGNSGNNHGNDRGDSRNDHGNGHGNSHNDHDNDRNGYDH